MKKWIAFTALFALSSSLSGNPCGLEFEIECSALYLQPSGSNLPYVVVADSSSFSPHWKIKDLKPDYHGGFDVEISTIFSDNTKASLHYLHFDSKDTETTKAKLVAPLFEIDPDLTAFTLAIGHTKFRYDAGSLKFGVGIDFGDSISTNFFCGVGFASIEQRTKNFYSNADASISTQIKTPSTFIGAGPEFGVDFAYEICNGLQIVGAGSGALLFGSLTNHTDYDSVSPLLVALGISPNSQSTHVKNRTGIVPGFEGKLGLGYAFQLGGSLFALNAGYQVMYYLNAIQSVDIGSEVDSLPIKNSGVFARTFHRTLSNFALAGPYLTVNVTF